MTEYLLEDCLVVAEKSDAKKVGVLVYASHKRFGGGYRNHSKAQEEFLFNKTTLPSCKPPKGFYPLSHASIGGFHLDARLRSGKEIVFIFVPAPVWKINKRTKVLRGRAKMIFDLASKAGVDHLILGGWGCGVFGCPPQLISDTLHEFSPEDLRISYAFLDEKIKNKFSGD